MTPERQSELMQAISDTPIGEMNPPWARAAMRELSSALDDERAKLAVARALLVDMNENDEVRYFYGDKISHALARLDVTP